MVRASKLLITISALLCAATSVLAQACTTSSITLTQTVVSSWPGGAQYDAVLKNEGSRVVSDLTISSEAAAINSLWILEAQGTGRYHFPSYISSMAAGATVQFGYTAPSQVNFRVSSVVCAGSGPVESSDSASSTDSSAEPSSFATFVYSNATQNTFGLSSLRVTVPAGYKVVGGGGSIGFANLGSGGSQLAASYPIDETTWEAKGRTHTADAGPFNLVVWAFAIFDPNNEYEVKIFTESDTSAATTGSALGALISDPAFALSGGGVNTDHFVQATFPAEFNQWSATWTTDPLRGQPTVAAAWSVYAVGVRSRSSARTVTSTVRSANGSGSGAASATATVPAGFFVSGGGIQSFGGLIVALRPEPTDGFTATNVNPTGAQGTISLTAFAVGLSVSASSCANGECSSSSEPEVPPTTCSVAVSQTLRTTWTAGSETFRLYDVTLTNTGSVQVNSPSFFVRSSGQFQITQSWNVVSSTVSGQQVLSMPANTPLAAGASYTGAGYVVSAETTVALNACL
eukprot:TRINITY_DN16025_c0_g1_i2.p1 TRINITY_DN16025_c0_g1~~TRINITY_DN16025_c0_g1_i2.p1  ORF type:complete len:516 (+),score=146.12 TRINITY_DN16025_c0_g1_i2:60-1607(+)